MEIFAVKNLDLWFLNGNKAPYWSAAFHPNGDCTWAADRRRSADYPLYLEEARQWVELQPVLQKRAIAISPGEKVGIVGPSGSGKSVTFFAALGLLDPLLMPHIIQGGLHFEGKDFTPTQARALLGQQVAFIFQEAMSSFHPNFTVRHQFDLVLRRKSTLSAVQRRHTMATWLEKVRIPPEKWDCLPQQLSGGMLQRANLALGLSLEPKVLIADEVTSALDVTTQAQIMDLLNRLTQERQIALFFISHDLDLVEEACDRVVRYDAVTSAA